MTPEAERVKVWDMAVFGYTGRISFAPVLQEPLREAMKIWVCDDLRWRRNKNAVQPARAVIETITLAGLLVRRPSARYHRTRPDQPHPFHEVVAQALNRRWLQDPAYYPEDLSPFIRHTPRHPDHHTPQ